jgi:predicted porin
MKHKLLPTMIGAVLAGGMGAAQADITVFGHIDTAIVNTDTDNGFVNTAKMPTGWNPSFSDDVSDFGRTTDDTNFKCTTCSIGFKGSEDLGNGLKAIFYIDFQYDMFNRNTGDEKNSLTDRDQWLGLAGNFGQIRAGSISTSYKSHGAMIDPLYRTAAQGRAMGLQSFLHTNAGEEGEGRADNTVRWDSPNWNGFKVIAHYTLDSDEHDGVGLSGDEDDDGYGIGGQYTNGGILVFADYLTNDGDDANNSGGDLTAFKVGGKYTINNFAVMGQFESIEANSIIGNGLGDTKGKQEMDYWHLGGTYTMGNNMIYAAYGVGDFTDLGNNVLPGGTSDDMEQTVYTIAGTHNLSKRTMIYAAYSVNEQDNDAAVNSSIVDAGTTKSVNDPERDVFAIGMKHKF